MLPLSAESTPNTPAELTEALRRGLKELGLEPQQLDVQGESLGQLTSLRVDISGNRLTREFRAPLPDSAGDTEVAIGQFDFLGSPVYFEGAPLDIRLNASGAKAGMAFTGGKGALVPKTANSGDLTVEATREALESFLNSIVVEAAKKQGFEVRKTHLEFTQEGPRAVSFRAEVTAKVFVMSASLALIGKLSIDDDLNARLSNLALDGDGMILKLAGGFLKPRLDSLEGRSYSLVALIPGNLKLRDVELTAGNSLRVHAKFGAA